MKIRDKFLFNQSYIYYGDLAAFESKLMSLKDPFAIKQSALQFEIQPQESLDSFFPLYKGIYIRINLTDLGGDMYRVHFNTSLRKEHYAFTAMIIMACIIMYREAEPASAYVYMLVLWIMFTAWFQAVFRGNEESCVDEVVRQLRLRREKRRRTPKRRRQGL